MLQEDSNSSDLSINYSNSNYLLIMLMIKTKILLSAKQAVMKVIQLESLQKPTASKAAIGGR
jgi:hypothetical protein